MSLPLLADFPAILLPLITRAQQTFRTALADSSVDALASFEAWPESRRLAFDRVCAARLRHRADLPRSAHAAGHGRFRRTGA